MKPIAWYDPTNGAVSTDKDSPLFTPLGQVLPLYTQQEQEPVGKFAKFTDNIWREVTDGSAGVPLYTAPPPCPTCEALARTVMLDQTSHDTHQPQRTWVGLTKEERHEISMANKPYVADIMAAHEEELKRRNT